jgi:hypothetical protein
VNAIAHELYCPVCENTPLDVYPTTVRHQLRELIREMLAERKSEAEIKQYFVDYDGARVYLSRSLQGSTGCCILSHRRHFLPGFPCSSGHSRPGNGGRKNWKQGWISLTPPERISSLPKRPGALKRVRMPPASKKS